MIYLHVMNKPGLAVKSPADTLKGSVIRSARSCGNWNRIRLQLLRRSQDDFPAHAQRREPVTLPANLEYCHAQACSRRRFVLFVRDRRSCPRAG